MRGLCRAGNAAFRRSHVSMTSSGARKLHRCPLLSREKHTSASLSPNVTGDKLGGCSTRPGDAARDPNGPPEAIPVPTMHHSDEICDPMASSVSIYETSPFPMDAAKSRPSLRRILKEVSAGRGSNLFRLQQALTPQQWKTYMLQFIALQSERPRTLFKIFQELERVTHSPLRDPTLYIALLKHFVRKRHWTEATIVWHRLIARCLDGTRHRGSDDSQKWELDHEGLSLGVVLLCQHMRRFDEAFHMVDKLGPAQNISISTVSDTSLEGPRIALINTLIREFRLVGRFEAVHLLWRAMSERYNVPRDKETLLQVLYAANFGSIGGESDSMQGRLESLAISVAEQFSHMLRERRRAKQARLDRNPPSWECLVDESLRRSPRLPEDEFWDGMIAWQRARLIFLEAVLGRNPGLLRLGTLPLSWVQPSQEYLHSTPTSPSDIHPHHIEFKGRSDPHQIPACPPPIPLYPEIDPDSETFLAYIWLLGEHGLASQIPLTITWMRALNVTPSRRTLAYAFCFVEDTQSPLQHRYRSETTYFKLRNWVKAWLGNAALPSDNQIVEARTRILGRRTTKAYPENTTRRKSARSKPTNHPTL